MSKSVMLLTGSKMKDATEPELRHVSICECGNRIVGAKKQSSLDYFTNNEKYTAKCCGSQLHYAGEMMFDVDGQPMDSVQENNTKEKENDNMSTEEVNVQPNDEEVKEEEVKTETQENESKEEQLPVINVDLENGEEVDLSEVLNPGPRGVSKTTFYEAIKKYQDDPIKLVAMYQAYPELVKDTTEKYIPDAIRAKVELAVRQIDDDFRIESIGVRTRKKMETPREEVKEA